MTTFVARVPDPNTKRPTKEQEAEIVGYMKSEAQPDTKQAADHFTEKYGFPITPNQVEWYCTSAIVREMLEKGS